MNQLIVLILMFVVMSPSLAQVYRWTDSSGIVHFSDKPHPGAEVITLPADQKFNTPVSTPAPESGTTDADATEDTVPAGKVKREYLVEISQPVQDETIRNNQGYVPVVISVEPELRSGDRFQVLFDGHAIGKPQEGKLFALNGIDRGTHTIGVQIIDEDGKILNTSDAITFYMQRPRVGMVPATRPKPAGSSS